MKDYRERRNCRWKKSFNDLAGRSGITFSLLPRRQGKAQLDRKVVGRSRGTDTRECPERMYVHTSKTSKVQQKFCENRRRQSRLMDALLPSRPCILGLAASPRVWLREKNASRANATCESRAILPQWHGEYRLFSSVKYARVTLAMARCRIRGKHNRIFDFRNGILSERFVRDSEVFTISVA